MSEPTALIDAYLDGEMSPEDSLQLEAWLLEDESHRQILVDRVIEAMLLRDTIMSAEALQESVVVEPVIVENESTAVVINVKPADLSRRKKRFDSIHWQRHKIRFNAMTAVLTALAWVGFSYFVWFSTTPDDSRPNRTGSIQYVAEITGQYEHRWAEEMQPIFGSTALLAGERLNLLEGLIEITFDDGAVVLIEGPAEFVVDSPGAGTLEVGRLTATVPRSAIGFTVSTPFAQVVDLGTQFGVHVTRDGMSKVAVIDGRVLVSADNGSASEEPIELQAGDSLSVRGKSGVVVRGQVNPDDFVLSLNSMSSAPLGAATVNVDFGGGSLYAAQGALASTGNTWNQGLGADGSSGALVDSRGNATAVGYTIGGLIGVTAGNEGGEFVNIADLMDDAQRGLDSDPNSHLDLLITGLAANGKYNVVLYGIQNNTFGGFLADNRGSIFTLAATSKTSTGTNTGLGDVFVEGQTHVTYLSVTANGSGEIDIDVDPYTGPGTGTNGSPDSDFPIAILNGFQIQEQESETSQ